MQGTCTSDVGFVLDVSGSLADEFCQGCWSDEKKFAIQISRKIDLSLLGAHVSITMFNETSKLMIPFSATKVRANFEKTMNDLPLWGGHSRIDEGLQVAYNQMFQTSNGMRVSNPKTLVLITDGKQLGVDYLEWRTKFNNAKIRIVAIGVGSEVAAQDLRDLVYDEGDLHFVEGFRSLLDEEFIESIKICHGMLLIVITNVDDIISVYITLII